MFGKIASFELRYQLKSPVLWITFLVFFLLAFASVTTDNLTIGAIGNAHINGPYAITETIANMAAIAQFVVVAFVANVILRDTETGFGPIIQSTRIRKFDYLFGRFTGAFAASIVVLLSVPLAMMIGSFMPWLDQERLGPFSLWSYAYAFLIAGLPTLFLTASMFFALATAARSMMACYVGLIAFLAVWGVLITLLGRPEYEQIVALLEPYGQGALSLETRYWTAADRNTLLTPLSGTWMANRAIWGAVALLALAGAYFAFSFSARSARKGKRRLEENSAEVAPLSAAGPARRIFGPAAAWSQLLARARFEAAYVLSSPAFVVLLAIGLFNAGFALWYADRGANDTTIYPVTRVMAQTLAGAFTTFPIVIATYYAGELVWRDREKRLHEIVDSTPAPDWTFVAPKVLALTCVLAGTVAVGVAAGVLVQAAKGFTDLRLDQYLLWYALPSLVFCFAIAALAVFFQAISPHKFIGWGLMVLYLAALLAASRAGFDHNLYLYGTTPFTPRSEMNADGHYWIGPAWFQAYWTAFALLLIVLTYALWRRGADTRLLPRLSALPRRLAGAASILACVLLAAFAGIGGWIYYNTNILNEYRSNIAGERLLADMERALLRYEERPQPKVTDVTLRVDLYPHEHRAVAQGVYAVENRTGAPLSELYLQWPRRLKLDRVEIDGATLKDDLATQRPSFPFQIWRLDRPMAPGERRRIRFATRYERPGFGANDVLSRVNDNGTFIDSADLAPVLGFNRDVLLSDRNKRRKYDLPAELRPARLEDDRALAYNYLRRDSDWVNADITVSTEPDQIPVAPGYLVSDEVRGGRRIAHFRTDAPILHYFSIQSAAYRVRRAKWNDVDLAVYYDARHAYNIDRMIRAMQVSFDVFTREFSPFQFRQMRILEFPAYATFAQSFANTVPYSEGIGFITRFDEAKAQRETETIDFVTYVTAHEVAHQWWAHQVIGAGMQGATMLSETFASYSALLVMEKLYGPDQVRRFLRYELDNYLRSRGGEAVEETPLMRVEGQGYIHYRKGAVVMYFLRNEVGEEVVNRSMRRLIGQFAFRGAPYPRSSDFIRILREEAGPQHQALITDLFERITLYDARVVEASARKRADGRWDVTMLVEARKLYADGEGRETESPLAEPFEIGLFTAEPGRGAFSSRDVVSFTRHPIRSGRQTIALIADREPKFAGVDPYNKRIDRNSEDNVIPIETRAASRR